MLLPRVRPVGSLENDPPEVGLAKREGLGIAAPWWKVGVAASYRPTCPTLPHVAHSPKSPLSSSFSIFLSILPPSQLLSLLSLFHSFSLCFSLLLLLLSRVPQHRLLVREPLRSGGRHSLQTPLASQECTGSAPSGTLGLVRANRDVSCTSGKPHPLLVPHPLPPPCLRKRESKSRVGGQGGGYAVLRGCYNNRE